MQRIKKGDEVIVTTGKDKGRRGKVMSILKNDRVMVENINVVKKHAKPNPMAGIEGGIIEKEMSIHISNIMPFNSASNKGERIGIKTLEDGKKIRVFKSNNENVDV
jgi:large subunit ribosomal protein L24